MGFLLGFLCCFGALTARLKLLFAYLSVVHPASWESICCLPAIIGLSWVFRPFALALSTFWSPDVSISLRLSPPVSYYAPPPVGSENYKLVCSGLLPGLFHPSTCVDYYGLSVRRSVRFFGQRKQNPAAVLIAVNLPWCNICRRSTVVLRLRQLCPPMNSACML